MHLTLRVWRQPGPRAEGRFETYDAVDIHEDMSFLEVLDLVNERLVAGGREPIAFDRIIEAGGYISAPTGSAPEANLTPVPKETSDAAMDAAACIGCGACVAACPNGAAQLFTAAKVAHLNLLPQGQPERWMRVERMVEKMEEYFGSCTNHGECETACPKDISLDNIALMNRDYLLSKIRNRRLSGQR